jgi:hypothetical protein
MRNKAIVILFFILLVFFSVLGHGDIPPAEREALIALYNSTNGDNWLNNSKKWKTNGEFSAPGTEKDWYGITVSGDHVTKIDLSNNNLDGTIPGELSNLSYLTHLYLHSNQIKEIKPGVGNIQNLTHLYLYSNQLTGIPPGLGNLSNLEYLYLDRNQITGIPPELGNLQNLTHFYIYSNKLTEIPPELGNLPELQQLLLGNNLLTDTIPSQLYKLPELELLGLNGNRLKGFPSELDQLPELRVLRLSGNMLKGEIPSYITSLNLTDNQSDFRWNALYTDNDSLRDFLNSKQEGGDWESTQTVAPEEVSANPVDSTTIGVSWKPVTYTTDPGYYVVSYRTDTGEPIELITNDKNAAQMKVTDLIEGTTYHFKVKTVTNPHGTDNPNPVESEYSEETSATPHGEKVSISGRVTWWGEGLSGVTLTFSDDEGGAPKTETTDSGGNYTLEINRGWTGTVTPDKYGFTFEPARRTYDENVTSNQTGQDYEATAVMPIISGRVATSEGVGVEGVTMTFSNNGEIRTTSTDSGGKYSLGVTDGWSGTVKPSKEGYTFDPSSLNYGGVNSNLSDQDYTATSVLPVISGRVATKAGVGVEGVKMTFSNGGGTTTTSSSGNYSHTVNFGWSGIVTPTKDGYEFEPPSRPYEPVTSDMPNQDYEAKAEFPVISGRVATAAGDGVPGVTLTFSNGGGTATTNINGNYEHAVNFGWSGEVEPGKDGYEFEPPSRHYDEKVTSDIPDQDYTAITALPVISGRVTVSKGTGIEGILDVKLIFSPNGETAYTVEDGYYESRVKKGWSGTVTPEKGGYIFWPPSQAYENVESNHSHQNYTAMPVKYISGYVTTAAGEGVKDVTMTFLDLEGGGSETETTDPDGFYNHKVPDEWSGTVHADKNGYRFSPASKNYEGVTSDLSDQDYKATKILPVISGRVATREGVGVEGVKMTFSNGGGTATTSSSGNYSHAVNFGWSGEVEPGKDGYDIKPDYHGAKYKNVIKDKKNQNYTATRITWKISGRVTDANDKGVEGVTMNFSNGVPSTDTDSEGNYSQDVDYDWSGTVTPSKINFSFHPSYEELSNLKNDVFLVFRLSVTLTLTAERFEENTLTMRLYYIKLYLSVELKGAPNIEKYIIYRKKSGDSYKPIKEFTVQEYDRGEAFPYTDKYFDTDITYTYKVVARDESGKVIGVSDEISI